MTLNDLYLFRRIVAKEGQIVREITSLFESLDKTSNEAESKMIMSQINALKNSLSKENLEGIDILKRINAAKKLPLKKKIKVIEKKPQDIEIEKDMADLEKLTLKRLKKRKKKKRGFEKIKKPSKYIQTANKLFLNYSLSLAKKRQLMTLERALIKSNIQITISSYLSMIFFTTILAAIFSFLLFMFLLFFNVQPNPPFITQITEPFIDRLLKIFWIVFVVPIGVFFVMYFYPFLERKALAHRINQELPFATIHMAAISGSMIDPTKMFDIIVSTNDYPYLEKEFTKLLNEINVYGYNFVNALRAAAFNSPSMKLAELFNGLATTITSGGSLPEFFEKRSEKLLFEHRLEREKETKSAETFMDIYVSVVIAAPMILMLLLMMIKISGIGISLSTGMISLIFVLGVSMINIVFLAFLHLKQSAE